MTNAIKIIMLSLLFCFALNVQADFDYAYKPTFMPKHGDSMDKVLKEYGIPGNEIPWVGTPPITRWVYQDYTVYFEYKQVIISVKH